MMQHFRWVSLFLLLLGPACGLIPTFDSPSQEFCEDPVAVIQDFGQVTLPASADQLAVSCSVFMDHHTLNARFEISPADLAVFQQSTLIDAWRFSDGAPPDFPHGFGRFLDEGGIAGIASYTYGIYEPLVPVSQQILIDTTDPQRFVVYFTAFTSY